MYEGVPGAGKSYHAVAEVLLPWVRSNRRCYLYIDGMYVDRLAAFEGRTVESLQKQITVWLSADEVLLGLLSVDPGSAVLIDECQTVFRAKLKLDADILRWLETHRHIGVDVVLLCQNYKQVTAGVTRLVEVTTAFRRLDRFGLKNRYQAKVRGNPEEAEVIRMFSGRYDPKVYAYYSSYSAAGIKETKRGGSILKSPTVVVGVVALLGSLWWF
jgi:zona occludens toxin